MNKFKDPFKARSLAAWLGALICTAASAAQPGAVDFSHDIEPILIKRCSECHGPDAQKGNLRFDSREAAVRVGKSGKTSIVPGKSAESELLHRITTRDPDEVMPPKGDKLSESEVAKIKAWIDQGAKWAEWDPSRHWAFKKVERPEPPKTSLKSTHVRNEIDRFILARLEKEGLKPAREADRHTLVRRVTLDLTGLPPTWSEVQAFVNDKSPNAYERLVDRLLASEHYGEHITRWWLDLARYADSNGYQVDLTRSVWPYRDWVIQAFNSNMPFDQFTIEQLAGDLLPNATLQQKTATGFNRHTKINDEGGSDNEEHRVKAVKDRVATVGTTWMGLTMMCAECHTHKYDPITQEEYYKFYAFFNNTEDKGSHSVDPVLPVPAPPVQQQTQFLRDEINRVKTALAAAEKQAPSRQAAWEQLHSGKQNPWRTLNLENVYSNGGSSYTNLPDHSVLGTGLNPIYDTITSEASTDLTEVTAILLEVLPDSSLPKNGPGRWGQTGNFILDDFTFSIIPSKPGEKPVVIPFNSAVADWEQRYYKAEHAVDRNPKTGWAIGPEFGKRHFLIARFKEPVRLPQGSRLGFRFDHYHGSSHTIGRFRISATAESDLLRQWPVPDDIREVLKTAESSRTPEQKHLVSSYYRGASTEIRELERELYRLNERELDLASARYTTLVMKERPEPRETFVHVRGNFLEKGPVVKTGTPAFLPPLPQTPDSTNRLGLARWLVDKQNPLTARVTVNRLWERFFGTAIAKTSEDVGRQGEAPSHPELMDWLADEFMRSGWDMKHIQKLLVMSAAYRQDAAADPVKLEKDLYNRLLARGPRFRMDAEVIRDNALAASGLLNATIGGPSVYPPQISNLWKEIGFLRPEIGMDEWPVSTGQDLYRRGMYTFWRRVCTYPTFATFDAPSREVCTSRRPRTNTPLQALAALNDPTLLEAARVFAQRIMLEGGSKPRQQIEFAFKTGLSRQPTRAERERLLNYFEQQQKSFAADLDAAERLLSNGSAARPAGLDSRTLAAWMMVANVLFNLDESLTKG